MMEKRDVVIVGGGHNGLAAASYLGQRGLSVSVLEKNDRTGGAAVSRQTFEGVDVRLSEYAYLLNLFPRRIMDELGLDLEVRQRETASFTPEGEKALLISNMSDDVTRHSFELFTGNETEYRNFRRFNAMANELAKVLWPQMLVPLRSKEDIKASLKTAEQKEAWEWLVERPLGDAITSHLDNDAVRGLVFTDAKIGTFTHAYDESGLQNRTFAYHVIGNETGDWQVPVGGMGRVTDALRECALQHGVEILTGADVTAIETNGKEALTTFHKESEEQGIASRYVLSNIARSRLRQLMCLPPDMDLSGGSPEGSVFKMNMVLQKLPELRAKGHKPSDAFRGTFHLDEGFENLERNYHDFIAGNIPKRPGGEMYTHSLTDPSIMSLALRDKGYHTLTLFGLDAPYRLFLKDPESMKELMKRRYIEAINRHVAEDIEDCLALDSHGRPCIDVKSPPDLERELGMPMGSIWHGTPQWPFAERDEEIGTWGVETDANNIFICGSSAWRGGGVSAVSGHNAAMKVIECERQRG